MATLPEVTTQIGLIYPDGHEDWTVEDAYGFLNTPELRQRYLDNHAREWPESAPPVFAERFKRVSYSTPRVLATPAPEGDLATTG